MRTLILVGALLALAGCPEVVRGPRLVHYNPSWFYVRHMPWIDGNEEVAELAAEACRRNGGGAARLDEALQVYPFDLRYAVWRCDADTEADRPSSD
jgi:hypothetical protein